MSERVRLRADGLEWREIEGEIVALDGPSIHYLAINRTGAVLWPALLEGATREELAGRLVQSFDVDPSAAAADVDAFLGALRAHDLLEA